ncbi:transposase [Pseudanabaena sp. FACHB-1998]|nr:transposase [Pseudanabaena sp. FACHB-1998]
MVDSQATKNTCNASIESKGFCHYKSTNGIKRHLAVDTLGFPFFTYSTKASVSDDRGLIEMFEQNIDYFKSKPLNVSKITIMDHGYNPENLTKELEKIYPQIMTKIKFKLAPKLSKAEKEASRKSGFVAIPVRWVVERSNAWVEKCKSLVKNFDRTLDNANARLKLCFIRLMLKRIAKAS